MIAYTLGGKKIRPNCCVLHCSCDQCALAFNAEFQDDCVYTLGQKIC